MKSERGMTLMEILIVVSMIAMVNIAVYNAINNGIKVWERAERLVIEEDIALFFDQISEDLRNAYRYSKLTFRGNMFSLSFPTMVRTLSDSGTGIHEDEYVDQMGYVDYTFDTNKDVMLRKQANYGQAVNVRFQDPRQVLGPVKDIRFKYIYLTDNEELESQDVLDIPPVSVEVTVTFEDRFGTRDITKIIDIPIGA